MLVGTSTMNPPTPFTMLMNPGKFVSIQKSIRIPVRFSIVRMRSFGPPSARAVLILFVPKPGIGTHESRGNPRSVARCVRTLTPRMWIESARCRSMFWPGRASLPSTRMNSGRFPCSAGTNDEP